MIQESDGQGALHLVRAVRLAVHREDPRRADVEPAKARRRQAGDRAELLDYLRRWDDAGRLLLVPARDVPKWRRSGLFPVFKSDDEDRRASHPHTK